MALKMSVDAVLQQYKKRKDRFQIQCDAIMVMLTEKYPELLKLRQEYASLRVNERNVNSNPEYIAEYKKTYDKYNSYLSECLEKEKIDISKIVYRPLCDKCNDTGFIGDFNKKYCSCVISAAAQNMLEGSNINDKETLANFDLSIFSEKAENQSNLSQKDMMKKLYDYITSWASSFPNNEKRQMLITGNVGLGKSYLLNAIAYEILNRGFSAMMVSSFALNEAAFDEIKHSDSTALNMMQNVDLLLIDDLGSEPMINNVTKPTIFNILNERTRKNMHTVVSSNMSGEQIEAIYGLRIFSRLINKDRTAMFVIRGKDVRAIN
jgi:DNA replication protein DnaC